MAKTARGQLYVSQLGILTTSEYNAATGVAINANLIKRLITPSGLAVQGNTIFVANESGWVGKYDGATGTAINPRFITGTRFLPEGLAVQGNSSLLRTSTSARLANTTPHGQAHQSRLHHGR